MVGPQVTGYLYPWDVLGDREAVEWIKDSGVDRVALAAAYHSVRAGTPRHPDRRVVDAGSAALYVPAGDAFTGQPLVPGSAWDWTGTENAFGEAAAALQAANLPVDAWAVLTHSSAAGGRIPKKAAARNGRDADIGDEMTDERHVALEAERQHVRHDVVGAFRHVAGEPRAFENAEQAIAAAPIGGRQPAIVLGR